MACSTGKTLAKLLCLKKESAIDDNEKFKGFWRYIDNCKVDAYTEEELKNFKIPTKKDFEEQLEKLKKRFYGKSDYKCLVLAISSHGKENEIKLQEGEEHRGTAVSFEIRWWKGSEMQTYKISDLLDLFDEDHNKTKIFLMQMCRTRSDDNTVTKLGRHPGVMHHSETVPDRHKSASLPSLPTSSSEIFPQPWPKTWKIGQPCIRNSVIMFSAPSGYKSHTNYNRYFDGGGWLFVTMEEVMQKMIKDKTKEISVIDLLLMVNEEMSKKETLNGKEVGLSSFNHMLTKDFCFMVGQIVKT